jgi:small subunit ribosomal protein S8
MSMSDPLADMLTRIRNAGMANFDNLKMPHSNLKSDVAKILKEEGYITDYQFIDNGVVDRVLHIDLKCDQEGTRVISGLKRESKPGRRVYAKYNEIPKVMSGLGISILSTSSGLMTDRKARSLKVGGEILCSVW